MSDRNLALKYEILKTRISTLVEEHADALALAQVFRKDFNESYEKCQDAEKRIIILEEELRQRDVQKEESTTIIHSVESTDR